MYFPQSADHPFSLSMPQPPYSSVSTDTGRVPGFRTVPRTGVIHVMHRARAEGFTPDHPEWANLGQGAPSTTRLPDAPQRIECIACNAWDQEYAPVAGRQDLRMQVAEFYNHFHRQGKRSKYTWRNVCIAPGGRAALTRIAAALGNINLGHFIPDYTAYEELLSVFRSFTPIPILLDPANAYRMAPSTLEREIVSRGLGALLASNPSNPTGRLVAGEELRQWVELSRFHGCALIMDEFYSHYVYGRSELRVSAAEFVEDVERDPVVVVDGVTKNWRYPGWRVGWVVGPSEVIEAMASAGSFLDGGANHPVQRAAATLLSPEVAEREIAAIRMEFGHKRDYLLRELGRLGFVIEAVPEGAFYVWANLKALPGEFREAMVFFERALEEKVIVVPGVFFDVNPDRRRPHSCYRNHIRLSFGPDMEVLRRGVARLERMLRRHA
ncbi:Aspartate transaminase [Solidesulfovibrio carbinoliphilus subsp. oakridgensis]|uniref:Aspartate transaminase n=1 Tax=Solidesulfovibrio carbinoliphilus subsp. oakridgensis TaxID=694327 RepID=G7Q5Y4_9BACT|nr:pyridoxal phosphate-dependent aminotransferase [Solidesulfovibrio carbinoliphilus]EHJ46921.1 Aspartate transaminase [Solidesulfovibrio carbinoliphilus subsp. oakridgensis]